MKKFLILSLLVLSLTACIEENTEEPIVKDEQQTESTQKIIQNEELTNSILGEESVIAGQVYEQNGLVIGTLLLVATVTDEDGKKIAEKYANELKKEYNDFPVNVQAVRDGENIANISLD